MPYLLNYIVQLSVICFSVGTHEKHPIPSPHGQAMECVIVGTLVEHVLIIYIIMDFDCRVYVVSILIISHIIMQLDGRLVCIYVGGHQTSPV